MQEFLNLLRPFGTERHSTSSLPEEGGRVRRGLFVLEGMLDFHGVPLLGERKGGDPGNIFFPFLREKPSSTFPRKKEIPYLLEITPRGESPDSRSSLGGFGRTEGSGSASLAYLPGGGSALRLRKRCLPGMCPFPRAIWIAFPGRNCNLSGRIGMRGLRKRKGYGWSCARGALFSSVKRRWSPKNSIIPGNISGCAASRSVPSKARRGRISAPEGFSGRPWRITWNWI